MLNVFRACFVVDVLNKVDAKVLIQILHTLLQLNPLVVFITCHCLLSPQVIYASKDPVWEQGFTFFVHNVKTQQLTVQVCHLLVRTPPIFNNSDRTLGIGMNTNGYLSIECL